MIVFVGDKPSAKNLDPNIPFVGTKSYKTLLGWIADLDVDLNVTKVRNKDAAEELAILQSWFPHPIKIVALGNAAAEALERCGASYFKLPHPSGLNRQLNDKDFLKKRLLQCKEWLHAKNIQDNIQ